MDSSGGITLLHVSDTQFGRNHRFGRLDSGDADETFDSLLSRLTIDLKTLFTEGVPQPDLVLLTGDLAEAGGLEEFADVVAFATGLARFLKLPPDRVVVVPGNHDINWHECSTYFSTRRAQDQDPQPPYWPKWGQFVGQLFQKLYVGHPSLTFTEGQPWTLFAMAELKVVVAGLNSTMRESHQKDDHYGWLGEQQLHWFADQLKGFRDKGWLRIVALHHNLRRGPTRDDESLRDFEVFQQLLGDLVNVVFHGHTHDGKLDWLSPRVPILATGSAAVEMAQRPPEIPNQYQLVRLRADGFDRWARHYVPLQKRWAGDTTSSSQGNEWRTSYDIRFKSVGGTFPPVARRPTAAASALARRRELKHALSEAFDYAGLRIMVHDYLGVDLEDITVAPNKKEAIDDLVVWAEQTSQVPDLIAAARAANSTSLALNGLSADAWKQARVDWVEPSSQGLASAAIPVLTPNRPWANQVTQDRTRSRRNAFLVLVALAVGGVLLVGTVPSLRRIVSTHPGPTPVPTVTAARCRLSISWPSEGVEVGREGLVRGEAEVYPGVYPWIVVRRTDIEDLWWPQGSGPLNLRDGQWRSAIRYGTPQDVGHSFEVAVVVVDQQQSQRFAAWARDSGARNDFRPIPIAALSDISVPGCTPAATTVTAGGALPCRSVLRNEIQERRLTASLDEAQRYARSGSDAGMHEALQVYRRLIDALSDEGRRCLAGPLLDGARAEEAKGDTQKAVEYYRGLFSGSLPVGREDLARQEGAR